MIKYLIKEKAEVNAVDSVSLYVYNTYVVMHQWLFEVLDISVLTLFPLWHDQCYNVKLMFYDQLIWLIFGRQCRSIKYNRWWKIGLLWAPNNQLK